MSYCVTNMEALQANLATTSSTLMLYRANLGRVTMLEEERANTLWRMELQLGELNAVRLKLVRPQRKAFQILFDTHLGERSAAND